MKRRALWFVLLVVVVVATVALIPRPTAQKLVSFLRDESPTEQGSNQHTKSGLTYRWSVFVLQGDDSQMPVWKSELRKNGWKEVSSGLGTHAHLFETGVSERLYVIRDFALQGFGYSDNSMGWGGRTLNNRASFVFVTTDQPTLLQRFRDWLGF